MNKYQILGLLKTQNLVNAKDLNNQSINITSKALRMHIMRLRLEGYEIFGYRGRGYSLDNQILLTNKEMEVLKLLSDYTIWSSEDISANIWGDYNSYLSVSGYISRLRKHGYEIKNIFKQ